MSVVHSLSILLLTLLLAACDAEREEAAQRKAEPAPASTQPDEPPLVPPPTAPSVTPAAPAAAPAPRPALPVRVEPVVRVQPSRPALPGEQAPPLDLRLPKEMLQEFRRPSGRPGEAGEPAPLLPPLFRDAEEAGSFQLGGRLITDENADEDSWHAVDGAELQLQFRR